MTMTDDRLTETASEPAPVSRQEWMAWCARRDNNIGPAELEADRRMTLLRAKERLRGAVEATSDLQHELRTKMRRLTAANGLRHEVPSPFFVDSCGRDEKSWRDDASEAQAALAALPAAGNDLEWRQRCDLRLRVATSWNAAETLAYNAVSLRRQIAECRDQIRRLEAELTTASRVAPIDIPPVKR